MPLSHADSNHRLVMEVLLQKLYGKDVSFEAQGKNASNGHSAHVVALEEKLLGNLDDCAADYAQRMEASLSSSKSVDLVLLGMGPDGHTCSLFPGHRDFVETDMRTVVPVRDSPKPPAERISLSMHAVDCARAIAMVCTGDGKKTVVKEIIEGHAVGYPAGRATYGGASSSKEDNGRVIEWFVDTAAASMLDDASVATSGWKVSRVD